MPVDLASLVHPRHSALVLNECQRGVMGDLSALPELAESARGEVTANIARLVDAAHAVGVPVLHCLALRREDGLGANENARLFQYMARVATKLHPGSAAAEVVPEIRVDARDLLLPRLHGLSPFQGTELDSVLRNARVQTIVAVGVSVNVAIPNLTFDAVNASYQVVIPRDAVAGFPRDYVEAVFQHTLGAISTPTATDDLVALWKR